MDHIEHFDIFDAELLTLPRPSRVDVHDNFHSNGNDQMVAFFSSGFTHLFGRAS
jgi:hypothetical protein